MSIKQQKTVRKYIQEELRVNKLMTYILGYLFGLLTFKYAGTSKQLLFWAIVFPLGLILFIPLKAYFRSQKE